MFAYLDAGTGSMIAGAVAAGAAGVATVGRMAWYKVSPGKRRKAEQATEESTEPASTDVTEDVQDVEADA